MNDILNKICADVSEGDQQILAQTFSKIRLTRFRRGVTMYTSGAPFNGIYIINCGVAKTFMRVDSQEVLTTISLPNDIVGGDSLHRGFYESTVISAEETEAVWVPAECLPILLRVSDEFSSYFSERISQAIVDNTTMIRVLAKAKAEARVAYLLLKFSYAERSTGEVGSRVCIFLSRADMAAYLGLRFETVSRKLVLFRKLGHVELSGRTVRVRNSVALKEICHSL